MSATLVICGDLHYRGSNPRGRLDNFQEALDAKLREVFHVARDKEATAIIIPGDIFDSFNTSWSVVADLASLLTEQPCPVLTVMGNHDIAGGNQETVRRTPYGLLARLGLIRDLQMEPYEFSPEYNLIITITGHGYNTETDVDMGQFTPPPDDYPEIRFKIHVVHSMLLEKPPGFDMRHTLVRNVKTTADVIISGHYHLGFPEHPAMCVDRDDGVMFINPGALCRLAATPAEMDRPIGVVLAEIFNTGIEDKPGMTCQFIPLQSARPGYEVLSRDHLEAEQEREERINRFLGLLAAEGEAKFLEIQEIIDDIAKREELPAAVVKEALNRIGRAREALGGRNT
ncbi:metallophosphoesterase [Moorella sp. E306M]|uniref:metallophosphoesterase n=1 Tax=Moorella sp. E306M TaxID=2572683 RepID=UPI0010FFB624|nr:metallophosphoesterase [Moorella sp. E306M]GEA17775.1 exonuclease SbcD [Moorella sp. E306M]GEA17844.1 exonuclease SbcD [Moorella sp. E306M]